jgi:hypothetical protein
MMTDLLRLSLTALASSKIHGHFNMTSFREFRRGWLIVVGVMITLIVFVKMWPQMQNWYFWRDLFTAAGIAGFIAVTVVFFVGELLDLVEEYDRKKEGRDH